MDQACARKTHSKRHTAGQASFPENDPFLHAPGNYKEAYEKMFGMLEDSGWQLKMEGDNEQPDLLDEELLQPPAQAYSQGY